MKYPHKYVKLENKLVDLKKEDVFGEKMDLRPKKYIEEILERKIDWDSIEDLIEEEYEEEDDGEGDMELLAEINKDLNKIGLELAPQCQIVTLLKLSKKQWTDERKEIVEEAIL